VAGRLANLWGPGATVVHDEGPSWNETGLLRIDSRLARAELGWRPRWPLDEALRQTVAWHRAWCAGSDMQAVCLEQIAAYAQGA
jgi:CDP-glucose 4,6-dehydratase